MSWWSTTTSTSTTRWTWNGRSPRACRATATCSSSRARGRSRSTRACRHAAGVVPTGAKVGIDATIPEGIPKERYERITYAYADYREDRRLREGQEGRRRPGGRRRMRRWSAELAADLPPRRHREGAALLHRHRRALFAIRLPHRGARARPPARDREAVAGPARRARSCSRTTAARTARRRKTRARWRCSC
jgi:hypothetical protein